MKWTVIIVLVLAALGAGGWWWWDKYGTPKDDGKVETAKIERRRFVVSVDANGKVASYSDVQIKCKASGQVIKMPVKVNDFVKTGDLLLELDTNDQQRAVEKAQAALTASQAQLAQAQADLATSEQAVKVADMRADANLEGTKAKLQDAKNKMERNKALLEKKLVSQEEYETSQTAVSSAEADLLLAKAAKEDIKTQTLALDSQRKLIESRKANVVGMENDLETQQLQLSYAKVYSPVDGIVRNLISSTDAQGNSIETKVGNLVQSGTAGNSSGTTVMMISDLSYIRVIANVDETDDRHVANPQRDPKAPPQRAVVKVDALKDKDAQFEGYVERNAPGGDLNNNVVSVPIQIVVTSANRLLLKPGYTANVEIFNTDEMALTVPMQAVTLLKDKLRREGKQRGPSSQPASEGAAEPSSRPHKHAATQAVVSTQPAPAKDPAEAMEELDKPAVAFVNVYKDGKQEERKIMIGERDKEGTYYKVFSGLEEGDLVVLPKAEADSRFKGQGGQRPGGNMMMGGRR